MSSKGEDVSVPRTYYLVVKTKGLWGSRGRERVEVDARVWFETPLGSSYRGPLDARRAGRALTPLSD